GFIILLEAGSGRLILKALRTRHSSDQSNARFRRSIVKKCLEKNKALLSDDFSEGKRIPISQSVVDFRIRSVMCVPLCIAAGKAFGVIQLDTHDRSKKFQDEDLWTLAALSGQVSEALEASRQHEEKLEQTRRQEEQRLARELVSACLPACPPELPGY